MRIAMTGSSGLIGRTLLSYFTRQGHSVTRVVRSYTGIAPQERVVVWNPEGGTIERDGLRGHDVVIHLAGESIAGVWTPGRKARIRRSRVLGTTLLAETIASLPDKPATLVSASAVGIYGARKGPVDESSAPGTGFLAEVAQQWEAATKAAEDAGVRVAHLRLGNVLSMESGVLATLVPVFRLGLGARFGSGEQCWPWISIGDIAPIFSHVISHEDLKGPVNVVAPQRVTNAEMTTLLAAAVHRPAILAIPAFAARLAPGGMGEDILLAGACVEPRRLLETGYHFRWTDLRSTLQTLVAGR